MLKPRFLPAILALALALTCLAGPADAQDKLKPEAPKTVDLVVCLDTSGSMSGLIHAARQKLWSIVSEIATLKPEPKLRVALLTYGTPGGKPGDVQIQTDLTQDLDLVSEKLFALGTNGGTERVGRVIHYALADLAWSKEAGLKTIFVAGNESADQDPQKPFKAMATLAKARGTFVNAVFCGNPDDPAALSWQQLASVHGSYSVIDHNNGTVNVRTPFDEKLATLSSKLNGTYVFWGKDREARRKRQIKQDANAKAAGAPAAAERAEAKVSSGYVALSDLVERLKDKTFDLAKVKDAELPPALRAIKVADRRAWLEAKASERKALKAKIAALSKQRAAFVKKAVAELDDSKSLDKALRDTVRKQAAAEGFTPKAK